jgi:hypothetical protein
VWNLYPANDKLGTCDEESKRWMELAANEQDPQKLMALIAEINQLLADK